MLKATASSTIKDRHGDEFTKACVEKMAQSAKDSGMTIFLNHSYKVPEDVFGKTLDGTAIIRAAGADVFTDMDLEMSVNTTNPRAMATLDSIENGGVTLGVSIGCMIKEWHPRDPKDTWGFDGMVIEDVELLEASIVGIPANPRSWVSAAKHAIKALSREARIESDDADLGTDADEAATLALLTNGVRALTGKTADTSDPTQAPIGPVDQIGPTASDDDASGNTVASADPDQPADDQQPVSDDEAGAEAEAKAASPEQPAADPAPDSATLSGEDLVGTMDILVRGYRVELKDAREQITRITKERDEAREGLKIATEIVTKLAALPLGRKTAYRAGIADFRETLKGVYDADLLQFLERDPSDV